MSYLAVCSLALVAPTVRAHKASHLVTAMGEEQKLVRPASIVAENHLRLSFNDIAVAQDGYTLPGETHVRQLIDFARKWDRTDPMVIHCWFGISRSTASAYIVAAALNPAYDEEELARDLRWRAPSATPNPKLIELGDHILGRDGRMVRAIRAIGRGQEAYEGTPFVLPLSPDDERHF